MESPCIRVRSGLKHGSQKTTESTEESDSREDRKGMDLMDEAHELNVFEMKGFLRLTLLIVFCGTAVAAQRKIEFKDYPVTNIFKGKPGAVGLNSDPQARMYRTQLRTQTKEGANFAGHYHLCEWGCGTECEAFAIVDCANGKVHFSKELPFVSWAKWRDEKFGLEFRKDSRLLIVRGSRQEEEAMGTYFYLWDGKNLRLLNKELK
jgi:hypothetical protein